MNLFEIDREIIGCVDAETGEVIDLEKLESLSIDRDRKIENIGCWIKNLKAEAEALKVEKESFAKRQKAAEGKMESLKGYIGAYLNGQAWKSSKVAIRFTKSSALEIDGNAQIPQEFFKATDPVLDKMAIKEAIKGGKEMPGCRISERLNIQIK